MGRTRRCIWLAALAVLLTAQMLFRILFFSLAFYRRRPLTSREFIGLTVNLLVDCCDL